MPAFTNAVVGGVLTPRTNLADPALPLLRVTWAASGRAHLPALHLGSEPTAMCRSIPSRLRAATSYLPITAAPWSETLAPNASASRRGGRALADAGACACPTRRSPRRRRDQPSSCSWSSRAIRPPNTWTPVPNLLDSGPFDQHFVVEIDNDGDAVLRFGDDQYGRRPLGVRARRGALPDRQWRLRQFGWGTLGPRGGETGAVQPRQSNASGSRCRRRFGEDPETDRAGAPDRAGGVPRRAVPRRHRARLGGDGAPPSRRRRRQGELPLDRELAHRVRRHPSRR